MKILYVATISRTIHAFLIPHIEMLVKKGHQVDVACNMVTEEDGRLKALGCRYFNLAFQRSPFSRQNISAYGALKKLLRAERYDLVHTHTPVASACVRLACRRLSGVKVCYTAHGFHFHTGAPLLNWLLYYPAERLLARYTDLLITINREDFDRAKKSLRARRVALLPGIGIDAARVPGAPIDTKAKRAELGIPEKDTVLLSVGELNKNKNHSTVIRALARLKNSGLTYVICGKGDEASRLLRLIHRLKLSDKVRLLGYRTDVLDMYQLADVFVHPSFREGLPVSLLEAMAAGLPCVVSNIRGNSDLLRDGKGGILCRPDDVRGFASAIEKILSGKNGAAKMGRHNIKVVKRYALDSVLAELSKLYDSESGRARI